MIVHFVLQHGLSDEPIEFSREVQAVPREGEVICCDLGPDDTEFEVETVSHVFTSEETKIVVFARDVQPLIPSRADLEE